MPNSRGNSNAGMGGVGPFSFRCSQASQFMVSLLNHEQTALRQAQGQLNLEQFKGPDRQGSFDVPTGA